MVDKKTKSLEINNEIEMNLLNSSVIVNFIILIGFIIFGQPFGFFNEVNIFAVSFISLFVLMGLYLYSWKNIYIKNKGIEIKSIFKFISPVFIPYEKIKKVKYTGYAIIIDFKGMKSKMKLDLIYAYWLEFITINISSKKVKDILNEIEKRKSKKVRNDPWLNG